MLQTEKLEARKLAYDRPSSKLLRFLEKNFYLTNYIPQNNNFVVYNDYFDNSNFTKNLENHYEKVNTNSTFSYDVNKDFSYGAYAYEGYERNSKYNYDNQSNADNMKIIYNGRNNKTPWATTGNADNFVSSSSSYGAYYAFDHKKNTHKYY